MIVETVFLASVFIGKSPRGCVAKRLTPERAAVL
jgi:hypothetical protein